MSDQPQGQDEAVTDQGQGGFSPFAAPTGGQGQIDAFPPPPVAPAPPLGAPAPASGVGPTAPPRAGTQAPPRFADAAAMNRPGIIPLRPLTFGELLDGPLKAIRHNPKVMLGLNALVALVSMLATYGMGYSYYSALFGSAYLESGSTTDAPFTVTDVVLLLVGAFVGSLVLLVSTGITTLSFSRSVLGERMSVGEATRRALRALPTLVVQSLALGLAYSAVLAVVVLLAIPSFQASVGLGIAVLILSALGATALVIWTAIKLSLAVPAVVLERKGPFAAMARSWRLTGGRFWMILGVLAVASIITGVIQNVLAVPVSVLLPLLMFTTDPATAVPIYVIAIGVASFLGVLLSIAYLGGVTAGLYTDQRMRKEGFDLALTKAVQQRAEADAA